MSSINSLMSDAVRVRGLSVVYPGSGTQPVRALDELDVTLRPATLTAVMGPSGSGKSSLLMSLAGLEQSSSGTVTVGDVEVSSLREPALTRWRRDCLGTIFQTPELLPFLTAQENVELPRRWAGRPVPKGMATSLLSRVGVADQAGKLPSQMSGGQQQRVAIARALVNDPQLITADEPTGALDRGSAAGVLGLMRHLVDVEARTVLMVTHDPFAAAYADRLLVLVDGRLVDDLPPVSSEVAARVLNTHTQAGR